MKKTFLNSFLFLALTTLFVLPSQAQIQIGGHTKGLIYGLGDQYDITSMFAELSIKPSFSSGNTYLYSDLRFRSGLQFDDRINVFHLKEGFVSYRGEKFDFSLGSQIVKWGRTDGFNPTNYLVSTDYFLLSGDPDDQMFGTFMLRMNYRIIPEIDLELIGIPVFNPSVYRYELFDFGDQASFGEAEMPERSFNNGSVAARLNFELPAIGFSISAFRGYDPFYGFNLGEIDWSSGAPQISYTAKPYLKSSIGSDLSWPLGALILRAEFAYNMTEDYLDNINIPAPNLSYVGGFEISVLGVRAIGQYIGKYATDFRELLIPELKDPANPLLVMAHANEMIRYQSAAYNRNIFNLTEEFNHGIALTLSKSFAYDVVNVELTGFYQITTEEYLVRPKLSFMVSDGLQLALGAQVMYGPEGSVFDYAGKIMNGGFMELKASF